jgi:hypothetical protein
VSQLVPVLLQGEQHNLPAIQESGQEKNGQRIEQAEGVVSRLGRMDDRDGGKQSQAENHPPLWGS